MPNEKRAVDWETFYGLRDRSHGQRNGFCSECVEQCDPDKCEIWQSLPVCECDKLSEIAAVFNHFKNSTDQTMFDAAVVINAVAEALGKPWKELENEDG